MKFVLFTFFVVTIISCDQESDCYSGVGSNSFVQKEGIVINHPGFNRLVIRHHLAGTIDSFNTYIPCNLSGDFAEGMKVLFEGTAQKLDEKDGPLTQIAGEEYFVLFLTKISEVQ